MLRLGIMKQRELSDAQGPNLCQNAHLTSGDPARGQDTFGRVGQVLAAACTIDPLSDHGTVDQDDGNKT